MQGFFLFLKISIFKSYLLYYKCISDDEVCPSSLQKYFTMKGCKCKPVKVKCNMKKYNDVLVPDIDPSQVDFDNMDYSYPDVFEWLGGFSCGIDL